MGCASLAYVRVAGWVAWFVASDRLVTSTFGERADRFRGCGLSGFTIRLRLRVLSYTFAWVSKQAPRGLFGMAWVSVSD
jgi:hypothetical protein